MRKGFRKDTVTLPIDYEKLRPLMKMTGHSTVNLSEMLGFSHAYLNTHARRTGVISDECARKLKKYFGIDYEQYKPDPVVEPEVVEEPVAETVVEVEPEVTEAIEKNELSPEEMVDIGKILLNIGASIFRIERMLSDSLGLKQETKHDK